MLRLAGPLCLLLAAAAAVTADDTPPPPAYFFAEPSLDLAAISPGGTHVAAVGHDGRDRLLRVFDARMQSRVAARFGMQRVLSIHWATNERLLVVHAGAGEAPGLTAVNRDGSMRLRLIAPATDGGRSQGVRVIDTLPRLPSDVLVSIDEGTPFAPDLVRMGVFVAAAEVVERNPGHVLQWLPDTRGQAGAALDWQVQDGELRYRLLTRRSGDRSWRSAYAFRLGEAELAPIGYMDDTLLVQLREGDGPATVRSFDAQSGDFGEPVLSLAGADPDFLRFSSVDGALAVVEYQTGRPQRRFLKPEWQAWHARLQAHFGGDTDLRLIGLSADETVALVLVGSDRDPGAFWRYDIEADQPRRIGPRLPGFRPAAAARSEAVQLRARDGLELHGYLTRAAGTAQPMPLLLFPHGGPWSRDRWGFDPVVQYFVSRGFAVLQVNYRGSRGFGPTLLGKGRGEWGRAMQTDLYDALDWAVAEGIADPARVMIFGASYGGYAALLAAQQRPDLFAAAVAWAPVTDLPQQIEGWRRSGNRRAEAEWQDMVGMPDTLHAVSPMHLPPPTIPVLLGHGRRDTRVSVEHSLRFADHAGLPEAHRLWLHQADHQLLPADTAMPFFERLDEFIATHFDPG
jgi:alpha-beta hydrolase superfamily lysophospholipase